jgi:hypothetical protein
MATSIRAKVDGELTRRVGSWFTVREIQDKLRINPSTLKPLIMKYARERILRRRHVSGTARSVQFSPAAGNEKKFKAILVDHMPYRNLGGMRSETTNSTRTASTRTASTRTAATKGKTSKKSSTTSKRSSKGTKASSRRSSTKRSRR